MSRDREVWRQRHMGSVTPLFPVARRLASVWAAGEAARIDPAPDVVLQIGARQDLTGSPLPAPASLLVQRRQLRPVHPPSRPGAQAVGPPRTAGHGLRAPGLRGARRHLRVQRVAEAVLRRGFRARPGEGRVVGAGANVVPLESPCRARLLDAAAAVRRQAFRAKGRTHAARGVSPGPLGPSGGRALDRRAAETLPPEPGVRQLGSSIAPPRRARRRSERRTAAQRHSSCRHATSRSASRSSRRWRTGFRVSAPGPARCLRSSTRASRAFWPSRTTWTASPNACPRPGRRGPRARDGCAGHARFRQPFTWDAVAGAMVAARRGAPRPGRQRCMKRTT